MSPLDNHRSSFIKNANSISNELMDLLSDKNDDFGKLSKHLHAFIHERIDSLLLLVQGGCLWDADIIIRCIAEASVKLVYVSTLATEEDRNSKALEFWNDLGEINQLKQSKQARQVLSETGVELEGIIMPEDEEKKLGEKWTKKVRKRTEHPWSYNEMIKFISTETNKNEILCLARNFTQSSHIIHADETALGVIEDRKQRGEIERNILMILHENRLLGDTITFYQWILRVLLNLYKKDVKEYLQDDLNQFYKSSIEISQMHDILVDENQLEKLKKAIEENK